MLQFKPVNCLAFSFVFSTKDIPNISYSFSGCNPAAGTLQFPGNTSIEAGVSNKKKLYKFKVWSKQG